MNRLLFHLPSRCVSSLQSDCAACLKFMNSLNDWWNKRAWPHFHCDRWAIFFIIVSRLSELWSNCVKLSSHLGRKSENNQVCSSGNCNNLVCLCTVGFMPTCCSILSHPPSSYTLIFPIINNALLSSVMLNKLWITPVQPAALLLFHFSRAISFF